jgi:hypothetical protein
MLVRLANALLGRATDPDAELAAERPYGPYSMLTLRLAAACRLAADRRLLAS